MSGFLHRRDVLTGLLSATAALAVTRTALAQPVPPGAIPTPVYLAMATRGGLFLENTARDAHDKTANPALRSFARAEVTEQVGLADKIDRYTGGAPVPSAAGPGAGPGGLIGAPLALAAGATNAAAGVVGGTLGAVAGAPGAGQPTMTSDAQKAQIEAQLRGQQPGPAYDAAFVNASLQGHLEARSIHGSYAQGGEDPGLRRIAQGALPLIDKHIAVLSRMQARMGGRPG